ncbi:Bacteriophage abortive infection AbiH [Pricia antarctica]|uniref:Bacteriophage abortive infection AbiH n=1 Tax=Pricia antarctica TaxID=641691 RepID=A0A1G7IY36_9FLAO|nr:Bacteriophage abortive infection AbiH [Pricia antarctica]
MILGHSRNPSEIKSFNDVADIEEQDVRITEGNTMLDAYFIKTYKRSEEIINENIDYFLALNSIGEILIIGPSMSEVDSKYFEVLQKI